MKKITIAIDGYSSCGKSTMAKDLAKEIGYVYVDTGAMYRSVTLYALRNKLFDAEGNVKVDELEKKMPEIHISFKFNEATGRPDCYLNGELVEKEIRSLEVSSHVSPIAAIPFVREALVAQQKKMGEDKGIVMDGRCHVHPRHVIHVVEVDGLIAHRRQQRRIMEYEGFIIFYQGDVIASEGCGMCTDR